MTNNALIIGGSSGLGLEIALELSKKYDVTVTGRRDPCQDAVRFMPLDIGADTCALQRKLDELTAALPHTDLFVYAAGFYQEGTIDKLTDEDIMKMNNAGFLAPALLISRIINKQQELPGYIAITSTSQWTPRLYEPIYTGVKAGLAKLSESLALDPRVHKTLIAAPAGMKTRFWEGTGRDLSVMLDPKWAAKQVVELYEDDFRYKFAKIMREPARVEVVEKIER